MKRNHPHASDTVTEEQVRRALDALGINAIGLFAVEIGRVEGAVRVERLVTDSRGCYVIEGTEYVTESQTLDVI